MIYRKISWRETLCYLNIINCVESHRSKQPSIDTSADLLYVTHYAQILILMHIHI